MALLQWRKFNFFEVTKEVDNGAVAEALQSGQVTCTASGRGYLVLGDSRGLAHFINRQLEVVSHRVFDAAVSQLVQLRFCPVLAAAGEDELGVSSIKILGLEQLDGGGAPRLLRQLKLPPAADGGTSVTCLNVHENLLFMSAGFTDGRVILWRGDVTRERSGKHQVLHAGAAPVTGLGFRTSGKTSHLFVASTQEVCCYNITFKDKENQIQLDQAGCSPRCAVMSEGLAEPQFTIGRPDAIYCYSANERGACFVFEGDKRLLHWFKGYLAVLTVEPARGGGSEPAAPDKHVLTIYDVSNKYVALSVALRDVTHVVSDWGQLYVVTADRRLLRLTERDTQAKLKVLFKKNLYDMAIRLAQSQQYDADGLVDIFREYGDHLHAKGDFNGAIQQYIKTIGKLEPSYVIRKYLDTQRINDLALYLQALHAAGRATEDHTTLLINCYTKLRDTIQLDMFIQGEDGAVGYDVDTAVRVCRSSGYYEQALTMARRHQQTDRVIAILTEDLADPGRALQYVAQLPHQQCEAAILRHGAALLKERPQETVELLKKLCCAEPQLEAEAELAVPIERYLDLFVAQPDAQGRLPPAPDGVQRTESALRLLDSPRLDLPLALHLCHSRGFQQGTAKLYERAGMHSQILQTQLEAGDYEPALETCRRYGQTLPHLWLEALRALTKQLEAPAGVIVTVLDTIEKGKLAPSMEVLEMLVESPTLELGTIRDYMSRTLSADQADIDADAQTADKYAAEASRIREQIHREENSAMVFQRTSCAACNQQLELPSVHFFCPHSYHQHCFQSYADRDDDCPLCLPEHSQLLSDLRSQSGAEETEAQFFQQLETADDMFSVVADYFGKGTFSRPRPEEAAAESGAPELTPAPNGMSAYLAAGAALADRTGPGLPAADSEARVRAAEQRSQPTQSVAEGRLRAAQASQVAPTVAEGRLRAAQVSQVAPSVAEGRLRAAQASQVVPSVAEGRLRAAEVRQPPLSRPTSEGRQRLQEAARTADAKTRASDRRPEMAQTVSRAAAPNPFEEGPNPFDEDATNPFLDDEADASNPFAGDADEYDKSLNPFEE
ncbi:vacuolar protein sorting-associated protein 11 homolog [Pollicipes pollicipes]|uniref:vacuolar protein sorting-associated protein 11 homolog n=1 Tax=Pollicipes pollicipes TaxID=41117 RepID=UPI0018850BEA|nr:vacuolar protein sorting-associated protein 11 homolog [Pollicipes pollicipes]